MRNIVEKAANIAGGLIPLSEITGVKYQNIWKAYNRGYFSLSQMIVIRDIFPEITADEMLDAYKSTKEKAAESAE